MAKSRMEEMAEIRKRFGDEQSSLLDQFERMSFEAQLNRAMLGRSLSEPGIPRSHSRLLTLPPVIPIPPLLTHQVKQGRRRRGSAFHKVLKKLLKPILGRRKTKEDELDPKHPLSRNSFSRSLRF